MKKLIFVHGWGYDARFWAPLATAFPTLEMDFVDLGYLGADENIPEISDAIFVTHSLGTVWTLKNYSTEIKGLIAINGFCCFQNFVDDRVLQAMALRLSKSPEKQMQSFWSQCGFTPEYEILNAQTLAQGLSLLREEDQGKALKSLNVPVLSLGAQDDRITAIGPMREEWEAYEQIIFDEGAHVLPLSKTKACAEAIKRFIDAHYE